MTFARYFHTDKGLFMKALIAMSGGVDSSLAAKLTLDMGYECDGCTMKLYTNEDIHVDRSNTCCSLDDVADAKSVAYKLGMEHYVFNFSEEFRACVIDPFIHAYETGRTPNPCIDCNRYMKFEKLYERASVLGYDKIVTGHYARVEQDGDRFLLKKALDDTKDQSYVLYSLTQEQLSHTLFPLGGMHKSEVRALAESYGFINANKADSQDICFVPDGDYTAFIERTTKKTYPKGNFVTTDGTVLGTHNGIIHYTIGQRKGLGISAKTPLYVKNVDVEQNQVVLCENEELFSSTLIATNFNWIVERPVEPFHCKAKIRYRHSEQPATVTPIDETTVRIDFDEPQRAITPGQAAVLYDGDIVMGGGVIC